MGNFDPLNILLTRFSKNGFIESSVNLNETKVATAHYGPPIWNGILISD